jgi:prepilin-type N-terminal cleavage/methylation domain-containing protein
MPPISPAPSAEHPSPVHNDGFTFIEVLMALLMAALLTGVTCASLSLVARTEGRILQLQQASLHLQTLATHLALLSLTLDPHDGNTPEFGPDWTAEREDPIPDPEDDQLAWTPWRLTPTGNPDLAHQLYERLPTESNPATPRQPTP